MVEVAQLSWRKAAAIQQAQRFFCLWNLITKKPTEMPGRRISAGHIRSLQRERIQPFRAEVFHTNCYKANAYMDL